MYQYRNSIQNGKKQSSENGRIKSGDSVSSCTVGEVNNATYVSLVSLLQLVRFEFIS